MAETWAFLVEFEPVLSAVGGLVDIPSAVSGSDRLLPPSWIQINRSRMKIGLEFDRDRSVSNQLCENSCTPASFCRIAVTNTTTALRRIKLCRICNHAVVVATYLVI